MKRKAAHSTSELMGIVGEHDEHERKMMSSF
jgi:hypothetical protein